MKVASSAGPSAALMAAPTAPMTAGLSAGPSASLMVVHSEPSTVATTASTMAVPSVAKWAGC
jgi:hypothetical protein